MHFWTEYGMFLAKSITMVFSILILFGGVLAITLRAKGNHREVGELGVKNLNEKYEDIRDGLNEQILDKKAFKSYLKAKKSNKKAEKDSQESGKRIFVLCFKGDLKASAVEHFREEVTAVLNIATPEDEVFVKVESAGGMIQTYGLAASQLARIRDRKIPLTVSVDTIAASGDTLWPVWQIVLLRHRFLF